MSRLIAWNDELLNAHQRLREALQDDEPVPVIKPVTESAYAQRLRVQREGKPAPFDSEAT